VPSERSPYLTVRGKEEDKLWANSFGPASRDGTLLPIRTFDAEADVELAWRHPAAGTIQESGVVCAVGADGIDSKTGGHFHVAQRLSVERINRAYARFIGALARR